MQFDPGAGEWTRTVPEVAASHPLTPEQRALVDGLCARVAELEDDVEDDVEELSRFWEQIARPWPSIVGRLAEAVALEIRRLDAEQLAWLRVLEVHPSLLASLDRARDEATHARMLAWALGHPRALGRAARRTWLDQLGSDVPTHGWKVRAGRMVGRDCCIDVAIETPVWLCYVALWIDASEPRPLAVLRERLDEAAGPRQRALVLLGPAGRDEDPDTDHDRLSFAALARLWLPVAARLGREATLLSCWLVTLARDVCGISGTGPFRSWSLLHQHRTLALLRSGPGGGA